ncbi:FkbM family methyltransferase [Pseudophaeobacter sp.]|uniref:FkbM family methyltransferase n=1 Tax=Pseudophaeobacter sp. TaxID=1971739 RepID=UPI00329993EB
MLVDWIRGKLRARRGRRIHQRSAVETQFGFKFIGPEVMQSGDFEEVETKLIRGFLKEADLFVNVGANYGYYVCLAQSFGVSAIAVEPVPDNLRLLRKNLEINGFEADVTVLPNACGSATGEAEIFGVGTGASLVKGWARNPKSLSFKVDVRRLDDLVPAKALTGRSFFLIDVEGFELEVLNGANGIFQARQKPVFLIESGLSDLRAGGELNKGFLAVFDLFSAEGYQMYGINDLKSAVERATISKSLETGEDLVKGYNFLMVPTDFDLKAFTEGRL